MGDNVSISDWEDLHVTVTVEKQATKEIPVRGEFIGTEADNCLAGAVTTDPETLVLKGPAKELEGISYALATVGGKEVRDTIVEQSSVVFMGPDGTPASRKNVTASAESVEVTVPVRQVVSLPLTVEIIEGGGAAREDVEVTISPETITRYRELIGDHVYIRHSNVLYSAGDDTYAQLQSLHNRYIQNQITREQYIKELNQKIGRAHV